MSAIATSNQKDFANQTLHTLDFFFARAQVVTGLPLDKLRTVGSTEKRLTPACETTALQCAGSINVLRQKFQSTSTAGETFNPRMSQKK
jgi:hypothetical protein